MLNEALQSAPNAAPLAALGGASQGTGCGTYVKHFALRGFEFILLPNRIPVRPSATMPVGQVRERKPLGVYENIILWPPYFREGENNMADVNSIASGVQKPLQVKLAISLLYAYAVLSLIVNLTLSILNRGFSIGLHLIQVASFLIGLFLISTISKGKTWPRDLFLLFLFLGICSSLYLLPSLKTELRYQVVVSVVRSSLGLIPIMILYLKPAKQWFESFKQSPAEKV